jgi:hypothetical protein
VPRHWCRSKTIRIGPMTRRNVAKRLPRYGLMPSPVSTIMAGSKKCPRMSSAGFKRNGDGCNFEEDSSQDPDIQISMFCCEKSLSSNILSAKDCRVRTSKPKCAGSIESEATNDSSPIVFPSFSSKSVTTQGRSPYVLPCRSGTRV